MASTAVLRVAPMPSSLGSLSSPTASSPSDDGGTLLDELSQFIPASSVGLSFPPPPCPSPERSFSPDLSAYFRATENDLAAAPTTPVLPSSLQPPEPLVTAELDRSPDSGLPSISPCGSEGALSARHKPPFALADIQLTTSMDAYVPPVKAHQPYPHPHTHQQQQAHFLLPPPSSSVPASPLLATRSLYASSVAGIKFVPSYALAVAGCMKQSQLVRRDPALIGKLLAFFIASFLAKYWRTTAVCATVVAAIVLLGQRWLFLYTPLVLFVWLLVKLVLVRARLTCELTPGVPMHSYQFFKHSRLLARSKSLPVARLYASTGNTTPGTPSGPGTPQKHKGHEATHHAARQGDLFFQPSEGYCGQASLNNALASIPLPAIGVTRKFFVAMPAVVRPFSLTEMEAYLHTLLRASHILAAAVERIELLYDWSRAQPEHPGMNGGGYAAFLQTVGQQVNDSRYRFLANYLRTPLFFCEEQPATVAAGSSQSAAAASSRSHSPSHSASVVPSGVSLGRKLFSGHWSPLLGCLDAPEVERVMFRGSVTPQQMMMSAPPQYAYPPSSPGRKRTAAHGSPIRTTPRLSTSTLASIPAGRAGSDDAHSPTHAARVAPATSDILLLNELAPSSEDRGGATSQSAEMLAAAPAPPLGSVSCERAPGAPLHGSGHGHGRGGGSQAGLRSRSNASSGFGSGTLGHAERGQATISSSSTGLSPSFSGEKAPFAGSGSFATSVHCVTSTTTPSTPSTPAFLRATSDAAAHYANYLSATAAARVDFHATERQAISEGLFLVGDVNPSYAHFLVPPRRLYDAVQTVNLLDGGPRGIVRITLKSTAM